jgi:membrane-associated phospholipid phosphatase
MNADRAAVAANTPILAARVLALTSVAMADGFICCWDAKYTYWTERPITADPSLDVLIPTPPFPSYTSGHSTISTAAATVLGYLFPADEADLTARAHEARSSRLWAGIHFPIDNEMGALGGGMIGRLVVVLAPGSDPLPCDHGDSAAAYAERKQEIADGFYGPDGCPMPWTAAGTGSARAGPVA